ncbi:MAG: hypothetical protein R3F13_13185 [Prosthecobacter sp.]
MKTLSFLVIALLALLAPSLPAQEIPADLSPAEAAAYRAAYQAELARLNARAAQGAQDPLAAPKKPGKNAGKDEWQRYDNAVAAWNQRTETARQQQIAAQQRRAQEFQAEVDAKRRQRLAAEAEQKKAEEEAAYQRWLQRRQVQAMEALARAVKQR